MKKKIIIGVLSILTIWALIQFIYPKPNGYFIIGDISKSYDFILISKNKNPHRIIFEVEGETSDTLYTQFGIFIPGKIKAKYPYEQYEDTLKIHYRPEKEHLKGFFKVKYWF